MAYQYTTPDALKQRILAAAQDIFHCLALENNNGILFGGAAAVLQGQRRITRDLDINVDGFPPFEITLPSGNTITSRSSRPDSDMRKLIHTTPNDGSISCDMSTRKLNLFGVYKGHIVEIEEAGTTKVICADLHLLLADKIATIENRWALQKKENDCEDIIFCIESIVELGMKANKEVRMPQDLKTLYTLRQWETACQCLQDYCSKTGSDFGGHLICENEFRRTVQWTVYGLSDGLKVHTRDNGGAGRA
ncbi:hypothetical protein CPC08DRAFT_759423 [Agrocybe pediades]|nr:hypothetical protein CPC08DRAFT_759423 [Agrocybe pediades]